MFEVDVDSFQGFSCLLEFSFVMFLVVVLECLDGVLENSMKTALGGFPVFYFEVMFSFY